MELNKIHHIAIIGSDYQKSKHFYDKIANDYESTIYVDLL